MPLIMCQIIFESYSKGERKSRMLARIEGLTDLPLPRSSATIKSYRVNHWHLNQRL